MSFQYIKKKKESFHISIMAVLSVLVMNFLLFPMNISESASQSSDLEIEKIEIGEAGDVGESESSAMSNNPYYGKHTKRYGFRKDNGLMNPLNISDFSLGDISYGDSEESVIKIYGNPDYRTEFHGNHTRYDGDVVSYDYNHGLYVVFQNGKVVYVSSTQNNSLETNRGISVGIKTDYILDAYGKPNYVETRIEYGKERKEWYYIYQMDVNSQGDSKNVNLDLPKQMVDYHGSLQIEFVLDAESNSILAIAIGECS